MEAINELKGQPCPICNKNSLTLREIKQEIPFFGEVFLFSMTCDECKYHTADVEPSEQHEPCKYTFEVNGEEDLKVRIVKSSQATVKIPHITSITPGPASNGYVSNIEGIFNRIKREIEGIKDNSDDPEERKKAKNLLKKIQKILWGQLAQKVIIEDPSGNSAIISDKAVKSKLKV